ncbi:MAG TPA: chemotaxis protein CheX [Bryobacteraceae bacterium]|nr:chemotaxis protein CheX [Bryobacteraceae bacterium]
MSEALDESKVIEAIRTSTEEVFSTMLGMQVAAQAPYRQPSKPGPADGVVALIGLAGKWVGNGSICCAPELACKISSGMLMSEFPSVNQEVLDAIGEVTNMVIGNFKLLVESCFGVLGLSIPMVIFGHNFTARSLNTADWVVVPFQCEGGVLEVKVCLSPQRPLPHPHMPHNETEQVLI